MITPVVNPLIELQPKQGDVFDLVFDGIATWIGGGGGRGGAKSGCIHRTMLARRLAYPGTIGAIMMRNSDQVRDYHEEPIKRTWPQLERYYHKGDRNITLPFSEGPSSVIKFTYAETLKDVIRRFRSANYFDIAIDQAEQFTEEELREIKQAVRWPDVPEGTCKLWLFFNMGGVGIDFLRKKFHTFEYNKQEDPANFAFVHFFPYDNVEWSKPALKQDGLTVDDYYSWSEEKRRDYCATRSQYGKDLMSQDDSLIQRDFYGSWESLEGAFFGRSFDRNSTVIDPDIARKLMKPWWERWLAQDWARGHYCMTYWFASGEISPKEAKELLEWDIRTTLKIILCYREYVAGGEAASDHGGHRELDEEDIARKIVEYTQHEERAEMHDFFLSPDAFGKKNSKNTIAQTEGDILQASYLPYPRPADNDRVGGWALMSRLFLASKRRGQRSDQVVLISADCNVLISSIPIVMRDPNNLDDVLKTDESTVRIEMDAVDACFVAGTLIWTRRGQVPIEDVGVSDEVMTRKGWRAIRHQWLNRRNAPVVTATFSDGTRITCTPDHRFGTERGFFRLDTIRYGDKITTWRDLNTSNLVATFIGFAGTAITPAVAGFYTGKCGSKPMAGSLRGTTSTTEKTPQRAQLTRIISSASALRNIGRSMVSRIKKCVAGQSRRLLQLPWIGTNRPQESGGTRGMHGASTSANISERLRSASSAALGLKASRSRAFAAVPVRQNGAETIILTTKRSPASSVATRFSGIDSPMSKHAASGVVRLCALETAGFADVYDLEVEDAHEFFANGILAHNCRYGLKSKLEPGVKPKEQEAREKLREMEEAGMDEHSLHIHAIRLSQQLEKPDPPARMGRRIGIPIVRR